MNNCETDIRMPVTGLVRRSSRRRRIAELQSSLMRVQAQLGEVNRSLRAQKPSQIADRRARAREQCEQLHNDFLAMFYQVTRDSLDPRQVKTLESGARALLNEAHEMGIDEPAVRSG
jgi:hypothetical protein